jgi:hypothetical protein
MGLGCLSLCTQRLTLKMLLSIHNWWPVFVDKAGYQCPGSMLRTEPLQVHLDNVDKPDAGQKRWATRQ